MHCVLRDTPGQHTTGSHDLSKDMLCWIKEQHQQEKEEKLSNISYLNLISSNPNI